MPDAQLETIAAVTRPAITLRADLPAVTATTATTTTTFPGNVAFTGPIQVTGPVTLLQPPRVLDTPPTIVQRPIGPAAEQAVSKLPPSDEIKKSASPDLLARLKRQGNLYTGAGADLAAAADQLVGKRVRFRGTIQKMSHVNDADRWTWLTSTDGRLRVRVSWNACPHDLLQEFMFAKNPIGLDLTLSATVQSADDRDLTLKVDQWQANR
jgi:hypothetical protein